ncbi:Fic family protein [Halostella salina]|uniref:hypothetical protein n=1 Tax=Halostella salina TaxID=1547897 RepID=UPI0013CF3797|nr:hypothetical protein [Halostella salina]
MATVEEFFRESNAIEDVYSDAALEDSFDAWNYLTQQDELTHEVVQEGHRLILTNRQPEIAGQYRDSQVYVGDHVPPDPAVVHLKMENCWERFRRQVRKL